MRLLARFLQVRPVSTRPSAADVIMVVDVLPKAEYSQRIPMIPRLERTAGESVGKRVEATRTPRNKLLVNSSASGGWMEGITKVGVSDNAGEFVVLPQQLDKSITRHQLQDTNVYSRSNYEKFAKQFRFLNRKWTEIAKSAKLPKAVLDRISWLLNLVLTQLLVFVPVHLTNTAAFLGKLQNTILDGSSVMETFDVTSLYKNVSNDNAMQAVREIIVEQGPDYTFWISVTQTVAMGQRLAPVLAVAVIFWNADP
ncbi:unnamed protein product [Heligmosomoides polygyrus]|uniref:Reverse transcriptase domain-containing protein n=1 Tax=Heligmosomoides polygyrus TaxID=6339 RepID=A0A183GL06_HELPZ|nr:unnamed protein product [Heligmosomoides polygyrus]